jgi:hypothetical protein
MKFEITVHREALFEWHWRVIGSDGYGTKGSCAFRLVAIHTAKSEARRLARKREALRITYTVGGAK